MTPDSFKGYLSQTNLLIERGDMAAAITKVAERLHARGVLTREELDLPESTRAVDLRTTAVPVLEAIVWAAFCQFMEQDVDEKLYELFNQMLAADDAIETGLAVYLESVRLKPYLDAAMVFVEQARAAGFGGILHLARFNSEPYWEFLPADCARTPAQTFGSWECLEHLAKITANGEELPPIPTPAI